MRIQTIAVLYGGKSLEHEISVITALQAMKAIDTAKYRVIPLYFGLNGGWYTGEALLERSFYKKLPAALGLAQEVMLSPAPSGPVFVEVASRQQIQMDVCLLAFHGQYGEDGCVQGLLELADLPYTGCGVAASALTMNKFHTKQLVAGAEIPVLPSILAAKSDTMRNFRAVEQKIVEQLSFPLFVKPNRLGSSIGISKAADRHSLGPALAKVFEFDDQALVEPCIPHLKEINIAVLEGLAPRASVVEIPIATEGFLSYEDKYLKKGGKMRGIQSGGMAGLSRMIDPPDLPVEIKEKVKEYALRAFEGLGCSGVCRFDFLFDCSQSRLYFNEVNPIPGSFAFYLWEKSEPRLLFPDLIECLIDGAIERKSLQRSLKREFGFHAL